MKITSKTINYTVETVEELSTIVGQENDVIVVTDENRGGTFVYRVANAAVNNGGTIFDGWVRQFSGAVNVKWFGAKGDGVTDDTVVIQSAVYISKNVYIPAGTYQINGIIRTFTEKAQFTVANTEGCLIYGDGKDTILNGTGSTPAVYDVNGNADSSQAVIAVHCSNVIVRDLQIHNSPIGIYVGADDRTLDNKDHTNLNKFQNLWFYRNGTGLLWQPGPSCFYNTMDNIQFQDHQICIHHGLPPKSMYNTNLWVSNRNSYKDVYNNNAWVGVLVENGDTCSMMSVNFESINGNIISPTRGAIGPRPSQIVVGTDATAIYTNNGAHPYGIGDWKITNMHTEACGRDLYLDATGWAFFNCFVNIESGVEFHQDLYTVDIGRLPRFYSNAGAYLGRSHAGTFGGWFHVKENNLYSPFLPDVPDGAAYRGIYIEEGRIWDKDGFPENIDFTSAGIPTQTASTVVATKLGNIVYITGTVTFNLPAGATFNVNMPKERSQFHSSMNNVRIKLQITASTATETTAIFMPSSDRLQVQVPVGGWAATGNKLYFNTQYRVV